MTRQLYAAPNDERAKKISKYEAEYKENKASCKKQLAVTDKQINAAKAKHEEEIKKKHGGKECLTVYDIDPKTKEMVAQPKPAHCKK